MNRRDMFKGLAAAVVAIPVLGAVSNDPDHFRWRKLSEEECPPGSLVDLYAKGDGWEGAYFGKRTMDHPMIEGCCWNDGEKGILVLGYDITKWRYSA